MATGGLIVALLSAIIIGASTEVNKICQYRDEQLPRSHWNLKVGAGCYLYCPNEWFLQKAPIGSRKVNISGVIYQIPITKIANSSLTFNYLEPTFTTLIASTFKRDALYLKWLSCARNGDVCCDYMTEENITPSKKYPCAAVWDAWTCFAPAEAESVSKEPCPVYTSSSNSTPCTLYSQKECWANGTWNQQTDYSTCASAPVYRKRHNFHLIILYISIILCIPAIVIFLCYRNLRITRVILHRNLLIACVVRNTLAAIQKDVVILDSLRPRSESNNVMNENGVACRVLAVFTNISANAIFACMLLDAFYLHKLIVRIFSPDPNIYIMYGFGIAMSVIPTTVWAVLLATQADEYCWAADSSWYQWIPDGFRIGMLALNMALLLDIFRGLLTKLKQNVNSQHTKSTLKAMSFLIPLFGVQFVFTASRNIAISDSCLAVDIYYYFSYTIQSLQGFMVALLFCYWNREALNLVQGTWRKLKMKYSAKFGEKSNRARTTNTTQPETRLTYVRTSGLPKNNAEKDEVVQVHMRS